MYFVKHGSINVELPLKSDKLKFDTLNRGSCFCVYSAFNEENRQRFDFRANETCYIESIKASEISKLEKDHLDLSDELKALRIRIEINESAEFDFFRYVP